MASLSPWGKACLMSTETTGKVVPFRRWCLKQREESSSWPLFSFHTCLSRNLLIGNQLGRELENVICRYQNRAGAGGETEARRPMTTWLYDTHAPKPNLGHCLLFTHKTDLYNQGSLFVMGQVVSRSGKWREMLLPQDRRGRSLYGATKGAAGGAEQGCEGSWCEQFMLREAQPQ